MKKAWLFLADRFDALQPRERLSVFLGLTALLIGAFYLLAFNPVLLRQQAARNQLKQSEAAINTFSQQQITLSAAIDRDPDAEAIKLLTDIRAGNIAMHQQLTDAQAQLANPEKMTSVLRDLIAKQKGLELVSMRTLKVEDLLSSVASGPATVPNLRSVFRHGIEITVRGDYASLAAYMQQIEKLDWKIYRDSLSLKTEGYPVSSMTLTLYTLSMERAWLSF